MWARSSLGKIEDGSISRSSGWLLDFCDLAGADLVHASDRNYMRYEGSMFENSHYRPDGDDIHLKKILRVIQLKIQGV